MPYICPNCDNKTDFYTDASGLEYWSGRIWYDENGEWRDEDTSDWYDRETHEESNYKCSDCDRDAEEVSQEEWSRYDGPEELAKEKEFERRLKKAHEFEF